MSVTLTGNAVIVEDERLRRFYWRDRWASWMNRDDFLLVKLAPSEARVHYLNGGEAFVDGVRFVREAETWKRL
jgi:hypothetical protein